MDPHPFHDNEGPLLSDFAGDADMVELIELFVDELPQRAQQLNQAFQAQDWNTMATLAHQLKGAGGGYGFPQITEAAFHVEQNARAQDTQELTESLGQLIALCRRAQAAS